jgi:phosphatidylglycerophosphate synthase
MTARLALVICPGEEEGENIRRELLGLSVGERLLLALERAGVTHVAFTGGAARPQSTRSALQVIRPDAPPESVSEFYLLPADLVFDPRLLAPSADLAETLPIKRLPIAGWREAASNPDQALLSLGTGAADAGQGVAIRVTDGQAARAAEQSLVRLLHKPTDGLISRHLNRKISTFISRRLARFDITPNQITVGVFLVGVMAGPFAFQGTWAGFAIGGLCYWLSAVLDGCDGEIARLKYRSSPLGAWLDTVVDDIACLSYITGLYIGLSRGAGGALWLYIGAAAVLFFLLTVLPRYYIMAKRSGSGDYQKLAKATRPGEKSGISRLLLKLRDVVFRTDFLPFSGMVTAVVGYPEVFAVPFALGAVASSVDTIWTLARYNPKST